jgi:ATP-dependent Lon protease
MNKRKPDDEFAQIQLSFFRADGSEVVVWCPESKNAPATQTPFRRILDASRDSKPASPTAGRRRNRPREPKSIEPLGAPATIQPLHSEPKEKHFTIRYGDTSYSYESIFGEYLTAVTRVVVEDPYIRSQHQLANFVRFCELLVQKGSVRQIELVTGADDGDQQAEATARLADLTESLKDLDIQLCVKFDSHLHDRAVKLDNGWIIKIGRGLDIYQKPQSWFEIGASDFNLRPCLETNVDIFRIN